MRYLIGLLILIAGGIGVSLITRRPPLELRSRAIPARSTDVGAGPSASPDLFLEDRLLRVDLEIPEDDWTALCCQTRAFATALSPDELVSPFTWFRGDITVNGVLVPAVGIRKKGFFGSLDDERPSLKIDFDEFQDNPELGGLTRLTLNNNKQDRSLVSQTLAYRMFRNAGVPAPRCCFAKVSVNGRDLGIYTHVESVDKAFLRRSWGTDAGNLYEGTLADFYSDRLARFDLKTGQEPNAWSDLRRLSELLADDDPARIQEILQHIDLDEFLAFWATESLINFWDGYSGNQNNFFVYAHPEKNKFLFIPWGADATFSQRQFGFMGGGPKSVKTQSLLANRLYRNPEMRWLYRETLLLLLDSAWNEEELLAEVDRIETLLKDHVGPAQDEFVEALRGTRSFIKTRRSEILEEIKFAPLEVDNPPRKPMFSKKIGSLQGSFSTHWNTPTGGSEAGTEGPPSLRLELQGQAVALGDVHVTAALGRGWGRGFGRNQSTRPAPCLTIEAQRPDDGQRIRITVNFNPTQFRGGSSGPIPVQGNLREDEEEESWGRWGGRMLAGTAQLDHAAMEDGAAVAGTLDVQLYELQGGFFGGRR